MRQHQRVASPKLQVIFFVVVLIAWALVYAKVARAQQNPCGKTGTVERTIADKYGESVIGAGIVQGGHTLFITANPATGTFTVLLRRKDGQTCIMQGGTGYTSVEAVQPGEPT
jgi:hypothetical protein